MATIDGQYRVVQVEGQGYGYIDPTAWASMPRWARRKIHVLKRCRTEKEAQEAQRDLPRDWGGGMALFDHPLRLTKLLAAEDEPQINETMAALGLADDGAPLYARLPSPNVGNILVVGGPGCGKSTLLHSIVLSLAVWNASKRLAFVLVGDRLQHLDTLPHSTLTINPWDASSAFDGLLAQVKQYAPLEPHMVLVVDEPACGIDALIELASYRGKGMHAIVATRSIETATELIASRYFPACVAGRGVGGLQIPGYNMAKIAGLQEPGQFVAFAEGAAFPFWAAQSGPRDVQALIKQGALGVRPG